MAIIRLNPFFELNRFSRDIDRFFSDRLVDAECDWAPKVNIYDNESELVVTAELPGLEKKDIKLNVENNVLTISGEHKLENEEKRENYKRIERVYGSFERSFTLPDIVDQSKIDATMDKGVLKITLPKKEEAQPKQIEVKIK